MAWPARHAAELYRNVHGITRVAEIRRNRQARQLELSLVDSESQFVTLFEVIRNHQAKFPRGTGGSHRDVALLAGLLNQVFFRGNVLLYERLYCISILFVLLFLFFDDMLF